VDKIRKTHVDGQMEKVHLPFFMGGRLVTIPFIYRVLEASERKKMKQKKALL